MGQSIATPIGRASFPALGKPSKYDRYQLTILLPKNGPKVAEFVAWLGQAVQSEARTIAGDAGFAQAMSLFEAFKDGDVKASFKTWRNEYAGHWVLSLSRKAEFGKPCVVNRHRQNIEPLEVYAGCNVLAYIDVYGYDFKGKKSVTIGFQHVMKTGENTKFANSGIEMEQAFENLDLPNVPDAPLPSQPFGQVQGNYPGAMPTQPAAPAHWPQQAQAPAMPATPATPWGPPSPAATPWTPPAPAKSAVPNSPFGAV